MERIKRHALFVALRACFERSEYLEKKLFSVNLPGSCRVSHVTRLCDLRHCASMAYESYMGLHEKNSLRRGFRYEFQNV